MKTNTTTLHTWKIILRGEHIQIIDISAERIHESDRGIRCFIGDECVASFRAEAIAGYRLVARPKSKGITKRIINRRARFYDAGTGEELKLIRSGRVESAARRRTPSPAPSKN